MYLGTPKGCHRRFEVALSLLSIALVSLVFGQFWSHAEAASRVMSLSRLAPCDVRSTTLGVDTSPDSLKCNIYPDFLVVGTGAGGAPLLNKLSAGGKFSVLGFEAGQNFDNDPNIYDPNLNSIPSITSMSTYDWQIKSEFMTGIGKNVDVALARMLGGSTSHNGMLYVKGSPMFLGQWANYGGSAWSLTNITATYEAMEDLHLVPTPPNRGTAGPVDVKHSPVGPTSGPGAFVSKIANWTAAASGFPVTPDYNGLTQPYGPYNRFDLFVQPNGRRESSSTAFLGSDVMTPSGFGVGNRRLRVLFKSTVTRIIFKGKKAIGVEFLQEGVMKVAYAKKEVIIAGSVFSAQILQNSGIGNATRLSSMGIPVVFNNNNVGENMCNHPYVYLVMTINPDDTPTYMPDHSGLGGGFFLPQWYANLTYNPADLSMPRKYNNAWTTIGTGLVGAITTLMQPKSKGYDRIQSNDPLQVPLHDELSYLNSSDADDFAAFLYYFYQLTLFPYLQAQDPSYQPLGWGQWSSVADAKAWLVSNTLMAAHYNGQNRMGTSAATGVVDWAGRVFGVTGVRVVDSTIIPITPDGNTAAITMMLGSRIADFILADYN